MAEQIEMMEYRVDIQFDRRVWRTFDTFPTLVEAQAAVRAFGSVGARAVIHPVVRPEVAMRGPL